MDDKEKKFPTIVAQKWHEIFKDYNIIETIKRDGYFIITSKTINKYKEARLMTKFDRKNDLPEEFRKNHLGILPTKRGEYIIGPFEAYAELVTDYSMKPIYLKPPIYHTLNPKNLYSEGASIRYAYNTGIFQWIFNEENMVLTVDGRMSSTAFSFQIDSSIEGNPPMRIDVKNAQIEIDAGYETPNLFLFIEAKNSQGENFIVRQLYYPYRRYQDEIPIPVIPIFLTFSDGFFHIRVFGFKDKENYSSLYLKGYYVFSVLDEPITYEEVFDIWSNVTPEPEPLDVPFPQADTFRRITEILIIIGDQPKTSTEINEEFPLNIRQVAYYLSAARYLGLVRKIRESGEVLYEVIPSSKKKLEITYRQRVLFLIESIIKYEVFHEVLGRTLKTGVIPSVEEVAEIIANSNLTLKKGTPYRRAQTVISWIGWIMEKIDEQQ